MTLVELWDYRDEKEVWQYLQPSGYNTRMWRTDGRTHGRTDTGRQQRRRCRAV